MTYVWRSIVAAMLGTSAGIPYAASPDAASALPAEITYLLSHLEDSACRFQRNGDWYGPEKASSHLERKYRHLKRRGQIANAEEFIARAASASSISGQAYTVQCADAAEVSSATWLSDALRGYRAASPSV